MVVRRCRTILKNEQSAYDAMQEVFLKVLTYKDRLTGTHPSALLYRIATNVCLNRIRDEKKHRTKKYLDILHNVSYIDRQERNTSAEYLLEFILRNEKQTTRKIAIMYFVNGMTIKEMAEVMNLSLSGVHKHLEKLRRKIRTKGEIS
jgi:RNA polymerase sigma-70 factor (ECF subfamily)